MKKTSNAKILAFVLTLAMILSVVGTVFAEPAYLVDTTKKGSLTLNKKEKANGSETAKPLAGVEFTIYSVPESVTTVAAAQSYIESNTVTEQSKTTDANGVAKFENLTLGRYYVKETAYPSQVVTPMEAFLVDIPMTNAAGTEWVYDVVADPKNQTAYGDINLVKTDADTDDAMEGVTFKLQKLNGTTWEDFAVEGETEFTTTDEGIIALSNLPAGDYRFVEVSTLAGYILDKEAAYEFTVATNQTGAVNVPVENEKVEVEKQVKLANGEYGESAAVFETDTIDWKISVNVPTTIGDMETYYITDTNNGNITIDADTIVVKGVKEGVETTLTSSTDYTQTTGTNEIKWDFVTANLVNYDEIVIEYQGTLTNLDDEYGTDIANKASVTYSTVVNDDGTGDGSGDGEDPTDEPYTDADTASVFTGKLLVKKTDEDKAALAGAEFKIATSEENAKNEVYVKDSEGKDMVATSDANGYVVFEGLEYGQDGETAANATATSYWIVETKAPTDYNLLKKPVEVKVNATSGNYVSGTTVEVVNKTGFELPETGAVGAILFTVAGIAIMATVVVLLKKSNKEEK